MFQDTILVASSCCLS